MFDLVMPAKSNKPKKPQEEKLKLIAKRPRKIKAAIKAWVEASDREGSDPLQLNDAPPWVEKAWAEVVKVVLPGNRLPTAGELDLELLGELMGRLQAFGKLFAGEITIGAGVWTAPAPLQNFAASLPQPPEMSAREKAFARDFKVRTGAVQQAIPELMASVLASSHEDATKFHAGFERGLNLSPDDLISANVFERHTRTFYVLALQWRVWTRCNSLREIYDHLCKAVGENKIGSYKTFENRVAGKIGLAVGKRGRPPGKK